MPVPRPLSLTILGFSLLSLGCSRDNAARQADSATVGETDSARAAASQWVSELGDMLVVPSDSENVGAVIYPDAPTPQQVAASALTLVTVSGDSTVVRVATAPPDSLQCGDAERVRLAPGTNTNWSLGLVRRAAASIHADSIEALSPADSARLAAELARQASALVGKTESRFQGLPFAVMTAKRFRIDSLTIVTAHLVRRLNQEASPLEEHTFLIVESASGAPMSTRFSLRSEGNEQVAERYEILAGLRGRAGPLLVLVREQDAHSTYEILQRAADGSWRARWSRTLSC